MHKANLALACAAGLGCYPGSLYGIEPRSSSGCWVDEFFDLPAIEPFHYPRYWVRVHKRSAKPEVKRKRKLQALARKKNRK